MIHWTFKIFTIQWDKTPIGRIVVLLDLLVTFLYNSSNSLSMHTFSGISIMLRIHASVDLLAHLCLHSSIQPSINVCILPSVHPVVHLSVHPSDSFHSSVCFLASTGIRLSFKLQHLLSVYTTVWLLHCGKQSAKIPSKDASRGHLLLVPCHHSCNNKSIDGEAILFRSKISAHK